MNRRQLLLSTIGAAAMPAAVAATGPQKVVTITFNPPSTEELEALLVDALRRGVANRETLILPPRERRT